MKKYLNVSLLIQCLAKFGYFGIIHAITGATDLYKSNGKAICYTDAAFVKKFFHKPARDSKKEKDFAEIIAYLQKKPDGMVDEIIKRSVVEQLQKAPSMRKLVKL